MEKPLTLIFYGRHGDLAKARAAALREKRDAVHIRHVEAWTGEVEPCARVEVLKDVTDFDRGRISDAYGDKVVSLAAPTPQPPKLTLPTAANKGR